MSWVRQDYLRMWNVYNVDMDADEVPWSTLGQGMYVAIRISILGWMTMLHQAPTMVMAQRFLPLRSIWSMKAPSRPWTSWRVSTGGATAGGADIVWRDVKSWQNSQVRSSQCIGQKFESIALLNDSNHSNVTLGKKTTMVWMFVYVTVCLCFFLDLQALITLLRKTTQTLLNLSVFARGCRGTACTFLFLVA